MHERTEFYVEPLEARQLMAGDVSAALVNGDLVINGDNEGNALYIYSDGDDFFAVYPSEGTTVNGENYFSTSGVTDDLRINLRNGDNRLSMVGLKPADDISVRTGRGNDVIFLQDAEVRSDVNIRTGAGNDAVVVVSSSVNGRVSVRAGSGNDEFMLSYVVLGSGNINLGSGHDESIVNRSESNGRTTHNLGGGNDLLRFLANDGEFDFAGGGGTDYFGSPYAHSHEPRSFEAKARRYAIRFSNMSIWRPDRSTHGPLR